MGTRRFVRESATYSIPYVLRVSPHHASESSGQRSAMREYSRIAPSKSQAIRMAFALLSASVTASDLAALKLYLFPQ